ncbi:TonB-dependent receptor plug domain-containing protein [Massilia niabensis]|uniref:TonB-dependent receptor plug domain-containing protein n=1 Tax=Massilia niabensis TaxID=544910 RepID=A0ABW0L5G8_9BURK
MKHHSSRPAVKCSVIAIHSALAALGALALSVPAHAQTESSAPATPVESQTPAAVPAEPVPAPAEAAAPATGPMQSVVVSASRISRAGYSAPTPTTVIGAATLEQRATVNIGDVLNEIPAFRGSQTPAGGGLANSGQTLADLRGLGATRTLVLLDRHRLPQTNNGAGIDLSMIPTVLIRTVDVVTGGASASYGSDAVSGVVNIVLNDSLEGVKGNLQYGATRYNDARDTFGGLAWGGSFAGGKGHIVVGGEYNKNSGTDIFNDEREWGRESYINFAFPNRAAGVAANIIGKNGLVGNGTTGGLIRTNGPLLGLAFVKAPNGATTTARFSPGQYGNFNTSQDIFTDEARAANEAAGITHRYTTQLRPQLERANFLTKVSYEFNDRLSAYVQPLFSHTRSGNILITRRDGAGAGPALPIARDNAYLVQALTPAQLALVPAGGLSIGYLGNDFGPVVRETTHDTSYISTGLNGKFGETWEWDVSYQNGRDKANTDYVNNMINANFRNAIDAVMVNGQVVCRNAAARAAGCEPLNILGQASGTPGAFNYIRGTASGKTVSRLSEFSANVQGEPFSNWAGPVSVGAGLERRKESLVTTVDPLSQSTGWLTGAGANLQKASVTVKEVYAETIVPLLKDVPFAKTLDVNGAVRRTDYSSSGMVTTWKGGLTWEPTADFRLRGTRSRDIRAPNLVELYTPTAPSLPLPADPRPGVAAITNTAGVTVGGNPNLKPEISNTATFGIVFQPSYLKRLSVSADYYRINIEGAITATATQNVVNNCLLGGVYSGNSYCSLISFANNDVVRGQITGVRGTTANVAEFKTRGVDMQLSYRQPLGEWSSALDGTLGINIQGTRVLEYRTSTDVSALYPEGINRAGQTGAGFGGPAGLPKWMWTTALDYKWKRLSVNGQVRYISRSHQNNGFIGPDEAGYSPAAVNSVNNNMVPSYTLVNVGASYDFGGESGRRELYFTVNNLLDRDPPPPANQNAYYDLAGLTLKAGVRFSF